MRGVDDAPHETTARRTLLVSGTAHAMHDGYADLIYVMLPVWQADFALGYAMLALLRGVYVGALALLQVPAGGLATRHGGRIVLVAGTLLASAGYLFVGASHGLVGLTFGLFLGGAGSSVQHPIASSAVSRAYAPNARAALGTYNFSGDLGKAGVPALLSVLMALVAWRTALGIVAMLGIGVAGAIAMAFPRTTTAPEPHAAASAGTGLGDGMGFALLMAIGVLDTSVRMGLLTFLPFLLKGKGATLPTVGAALSLLFVGGAAGKFVCGWLGSRIGLVWTVLLTETATAAFILATLALPLSATLVLMPLLGVMLNGTSSVLYGTVPELAPSHRTERAFAIFYTGTIGSGALAPVLFGVLGDAFGPIWATVTTALTALVTLPLAFAIGPKLRAHAGASTEGR